MDVIAAPSTRHGWFRFRPRTLLVLAAALAVPLSWMGYSLNWIRARHDAVSSGIVRPTYIHYLLDRDGRSRAPGGLWLFGEKGMRDLSVNAQNASQLDEMRRLFPESEVRLEGTSKSMR